MCGIEYISIFIQGIKIGALLTDWGLLPLPAVSWDLTAQKNQDSLSLCCLPKGEGPKVWLSILPGALLAPPGAACSLGRAISPSKDPRPFHTGTTPLPHWLCRAQGWCPLVWSDAALEIWARIPCLLFSRNSRIQVSAYKGSSFPFPCWDWQPDSKPGPAWRLSSGTKKGSYIISYSHRNV